MTLIEAAASLGVTPATLRQQIANGKLKARKVGRDWSVTSAEVERYRASRRTSPSAEMNQLSGRLDAALEDNAELYRIAVEAQTVVRIESGNPVVEDLAALVRAYLGPDPVTGD